MKFVYALKDHLSRIRHPEQTLNLTNLTLQRIESTALLQTTITYPLKPKTWWRYVDDIFVIWQHDRKELNKFFDYINNKKSTIKFKMELEQNNQISFLDVLIRKFIDHFETSVFWKQTHTNRYPNFYSNHQLNVKTGIMKTLHDRASLISSTPEIRNNEISFIEEFLLDNQYPPNFIERTISNLERKISNQNSND